MDGKPVIQPGLTATALMTLFSYLASNYTGRNFREPDLLARIMAHKNGVQKTGQPEQAMGWMAHAGVGISWQIVFRYLMENKGLRPTVKNGLMLGIFTGAVSVLAWSAMLRVSKRRIIYHPSRFYAHLVLAHIVFCIAALRAEPRHVSSTPVL